MLAYKDENKKFILTNKVMKQLQFLLSNFFPKAGEDHVKKKNLEYKKKKINVEKKTTNIFLWVKYRIKTLWRDSIFLYFTIDFHYLFFSIAKIYKLNKKYI